MSTTSVAQGFALTLLRGGLKYLATAMVAHGLMTDGYTEAFIGLGMAAGAETWSLWVTSGRVMAQDALDILRAKVAAAAAAARAGQVSAPSALARLDQHVTETTPAAKPIV